jgi:IS5 family transposase
MSFATNGFELVNMSKTMREFLDEMHLVIPWFELFSLLAPHAPADKTCRPPFATEVLFRIHILQQLFGHSAPAMEEVLHYISLFQEFADPDAGLTCLPVETTILRFRHMLEAYGQGQQFLVTVNAKLIDRGLMFKTGIVVGAPWIAALCLPKNDNGERDPKLHQNKKGNQWHFGMKVHIDVNAESILVHKFTNTAANAHDISLAHALLYEEEEMVFSDTGDWGAEKRKVVQELHPDLDWQIAMTPGKRKALNKNKPSHVLRNKLEKLKGRIKVKVEHQLRAMKCKFGHRKARYRCLSKNNNQLLLLFSLSNLWMLR